MVHMGPVHEPAEPKNGARALADRLWSRCVGRRVLRLDWWYNGAVSGSQLEKWFNRDLARWDEFKECYCKVPRMNDLIVQRRCQTILDRSVRSSIGNAET